MPTNIVQVDTTCPSCGHRAEMAWEIAFGALAGEELELGERIPFEEEYSFYRRTCGSPHGAHEIDTITVCPSCDATLEGIAHIADAVLRRVTVVEPDARR